MSAADELLTSLSETVTEHSHTVVDSDSYFVINPATRAIKNITGRPVILIEGDHNSEIFTFEIPRYIEGHDMKLCTAVKVHYNNIGESINEETGETIVKENSGVADLTDLRVNPEKTDTVICSWTIKRKATRLDGMMDFLIQYLCAEPDGTVTYEWHTDFFTDVTVKPGRNNGDSEIEEYTDLLEQWRARLFGAGDSVKNEITEVANEQLAAVATEAAKQITAVEDKGVEVRATIPEDYTTTFNTAEYAARQKANVIVLEAEGDDEVSVDNASDSYLLGLNVYGKTEQVTTTGLQLLDLSTMVSANDGTVQVADNGQTVYISGSSAYCRGDVTIDVSEHTGKVVYLSGTITGSKSASISPYVITSDGTRTWTSAATFREGYTIPSDVVSIQLLFLANNTGENLSASVTAKFEKMMLSLTKDAEWEPYSGGKSSPSPDYTQELKNVISPEILIRGKNVWDHSYDNVDLSNTDGWGNPVWSKDAVVAVLKPNTTYTLKFDVTCLSIPAHETVFSEDCGFVLYSSGPDAIATVMARDENNGIFTVGETRTVVGTFTTPNNVSDPYMNYEILRYTQRYLKSDGNAVMATVCFDNLQLEEGNTATEFEEFTKQTLTIPYTLPGIPVSSGGNYTDSNDQQWIADEIVYDYSNHTYKYVQNCFGTTITDFSVAKVTAPVNGFTEGYLNCGVVTKPKSFALCDSFVYANSGDKVRFAMANATIYFTLEGELTAEEWRTKMTELSPTILVPRLEPIAHELTAEEVQAFKALHTNYSHTTFLNDSKAHMTVKYAADTKTYTDNLMILTDETTGTKYRLVVNNGTLSIVPLS